jgi:hypothetical protein
MAELIVQADELVEGTARMQAQPTEADSVPLHLANGAEAVSQVATGDSRRAAAAG